MKVKKLNKAVIKKLLPEKTLERRHGWIKFEHRLQLIPQRGRSILRGPLAASCAEEWNVQELRVSCIPCRYGGSSDKLRCQLLRSTSRHALKNQNSKTKIKLLPDW